MALQLAKAIGLKYQPAAVLLTDNQPGKARQFQKRQDGLCDISCCQRSQREDRDV